MLRKTLPAELEGPKHWQTETRPTSGAGIPKVTINPQARDCETINAPQGRWGRQSGGCDDMSLGSRAGTICEMDYAYKANTCLRSPGSSADWPVFQGVEIIADKATGLL